MKELLRKGSGILRIILGGLACFASIFALQKIRKDLGDVFNVIGALIAFVLIAYYGVFLIASGYKQILKKKINKKYLVVLFLLTNLILIIIFSSKAITQIIEGKNFWGFLIFLLLTAFLEMEDLISLVKIYRDKRQISRD